MITESLKFQYCNSVYFHRMVRVILQNDMWDAFQHMTLALGIPDNYFWAAVTVARHIQGAGNMSDQSKTFCVWCSKRAQKGNPGVVEYTNKPFTDTAAIWHATCLGEWQGARARSRDFDLEGRTP